MTRHSRCHTDKNRRRRLHERQGKAARKTRRQKEQWRLGAIRRQEREAQERRDQELRAERKRLVQVLANRLYMVSPEHASMAKLRELFEIIRLFGGGSGLFPVLGVHKTPSENGRNLASAPGLF